MADQSKKGNSDGRLNEDQRFKYIGFEVFPGKPKDLFKNDNEKKQLEQKVAERRAKGDILREDCTLMEERVSMGERILLTVASVIIIAAMFFPFYSAYTETEILDDTATAKGPVESGLVDDTVGTNEAVETTDTVGITAEGEAGPGDSSALAATTDEAEGTTVDDATPTSGNIPGQNVSIDEKGNELITGLVVHKKYRKEFSRVSGFGSLIAVGSLGSYLFSSGFVLMLTALFFLVYALACLAIPGLTLYAIYGSGAKGDALTLTIKKFLKMSWWPVALFCAAFFLSFFGGDYSFSTTDTFTSIGHSYGTGVFLDSLSYGISISLGGFIILAAKGSEI